MLTVASASFVLSLSEAVAELSKLTGVLCDEAGLSVLSVKVGLVAAIASEGALSSAMPAGAAPLLVDKKCDGVIDTDEPTRPPT